jgi:uncharacterized protein (DUF58 family)
MSTISELMPDRRVRQLELTVTRRLDGLLRGEYAGLLPGAGSELAGSREYRPGEDEVRRMDWAVTARTDMPHVRETIAEHELTTHMLVDATPSMDFGTVELEKRELAVAAVAAIGFLTASAGNRLGAAILTQQGLRRYPARAGRAHLIGLMRKLLALPRGEESSAPVSLAEAIRGLQRALRRRALVVIVSDFLDESDWPRELRRLSTQHQVIAIEVTDPRELDLPDVGLLTVVDPETGRSREIATSSRKLRERYAAAATEQRQAVQHAVRSSGAAHMALSTGRDWVADIVRHVHAQRRMAGRVSKPRPR